MAVADAVVLYLFVANDAPKSIIAIETSSVPSSILRTGISRSKSSTSMTAGSGTLEPRLGHADAACSGSGPAARRRLERADPAAFLLQGLPLPLAS